MKQKQSKPAAYFDVPAMNTTAIASQFKQVCEEVANAIREQKGSTDKILPKDFSSEIRSISGGGSVKEYYYRLKTPTVIKDNIDIAMTFSVIGCGTFIITNPTKGNILIDAISVYKDAIYPSIAMMYYDVPFYATASDENSAYNIKFIGDLVTRVMKFMSIMEGNLTYDDVAASLSQLIEPITEEEFYNLVDVEIK